MSRRAGGFVSLGPKSGRLVCGGLGLSEGMGCGAESRPVDHPGGAAPEVHVSLALRREGWMDNCGSPAGMIFGISALCPTCFEAAKVAEAKRAAGPAGAQDQGGAR